MTTPEFATFDFIINDEDEVMLLLYQREGEPYNARIELYNDDRSAILFRNDVDSIEMQDIPEDVLDSLQDADKLLVCELSQEEDEADTKIVFAYEAEISD